MNTTVKALAVGVLMTVFISIPIGFGISTVQEYFLGLNGLSYESSEVELIYRVLAEYEYHPYMILLYFGVALLAVFIPSYVTARLAQRRRLLYGFLIGVVAASVFLVDYDSPRSNGFIVSCSAIYLLAGYVGGYFGAKAHRETSE